MEDVKLDRGSSSDEHSALVPMEPTEEMLVAGCTALNTHADELMRAHLSGRRHDVARTKMRLRWTAMLNARPVSQKATGGEPRGKANPSSSPSPVGLREALEKIAGLARSCVVQRAPSDDQIIAEHIEEVERIAKSALGWGQ